MASFRIRAAFDLDVIDEGSAREIARQFLIAQIDDATMKGEQIRTGTQTPAEVLDDPAPPPHRLRHSASVRAHIACRIVFRLLRREPWVPSQEELHKGEH